MSRYAPRFLAVMGLDFPLFLFFFFSFFTSSLTSGAASRTNVKLFVDDRFSPSKLWWEISILAWECFPISAQREHWKINSDNKIQVSIPHLWCKCTTRVAYSFQNVSIFCWIQARSKELGKIYHAYIRHECNLPLKHFSGILQVYQQAAKSTSSIQALDGFEMFTNSFFFKNHVVGHLNVEREPASSGVLHDLCCLLRALNVAGKNIELPYRARLYQLTNLQQGTDPSRHSPPPNENLILICSCNIPGRIYNLNSKMFVWFPTTFNHGDYNILSK